MLQYQARLKDLTPVDFGDLPIAYGPIFQTATNRMCLGQYQSAGSNLSWWTNMQDTNVAQ